MTVSRKLAATNMKGGRRSDHGMSEDGLPLNFPVGLKVLVVDDDLTCLMILERLLKNCSYQVTTCSRATEALSILRDREKTFDLVLSDVHMPDMDGLKLLEQIGLEMDLPVIMMSSDQRTEMVMRGVKHGACNYLIKPIRSEELKIIWQHVVRKRQPEKKEIEHSDSGEDSNKLQRGGDELDNASSVIEANESGCRSQRRKREAKEEEDCGHESDEPSTSKKPRVVWSVELHQQFVNAVHQLGVDDAVPKKILELMNVPGLTRENVASHLQKFRLYIRRLSVAQKKQAEAIQNQRAGGPGPGNRMGKVGPVNRPDIHSLAAAGQLSSQALTTVHAELLGQVPQSANPVMPPIDRSTVLLQAPLQLTVERETLTMGEPMMKYQSGVNVDLGGGFGGWVPSCELPVEPMAPTPMVNVLQSGGAHHMQVNGLTSGSQMGSSGYSGVPFNGEDLMMRFQGHPGVEPQNAMLHQPMGYGHVVQHGSGYMGYVVASVFPGQSGESQGRNLGFVGREARIPSRFAGDEFELQAYGINQQLVGGPIQPSLAQPEGSFGFSAGDLMSVLSK